MTPNTLVTLMRYASVVLAFVAFSLLLTPTISVPQGLDKLAHLVAFYGLTCIALAAFPWRRKEDVLAGVVGAALLSEFIQGLTGRTMSLADFGANLCGVVAAGAPVYVARLRQLAQAYRYTPFADIAAAERRRHTLKRIPTPVEHGRETQVALKLLVEGDSSQA